MMFIDLSNSRSDRIPLTYTEIKAYKDLTETPLSAKDIEVIKELDALWLKVMHSE